MSCDTCNTERQWDPVPYVAHEADMARNEREKKQLIRTFLTIIILLLVLVGFVVGMFLWYLNQYDFTGSSIEQDGQGLNIVGDRNFMGEGVDWLEPESDDPPED